MNNTNNLHYLTNLIIVLCFITSIILVSRINSFNFKIAKPIEFTNFDWEYYVTHNKLSCKNELEAIDHYGSIGSKMNLEYCEKYTFLILLHLFHLDQIDDFIDKINYFIKINQMNDYYIKINIPIDENINTYHESLSNISLPANTLSYIREMAPYFNHKELINENNCNKLFNISRYIIEKLNIEESKIQILFSENRGLDIGSFFLMLDQANNQDINHDFIIKIHTKHNLSGAQVFGPSNWREILLSFLNCKVNKILRIHKAIYSCSCSYANIGIIDQTSAYVSDLFNKFNIDSKKSWDFCGGSMFIVDSRFKNFFQGTNLADLYLSLNKYQINSFNSIHGIEHGYERLFGYIIDEYLSANKYILAKTDRTMANDILIRTT